MFFANCGAGSLSVSVAYHAFLSRWRYAALAWPNLSLNPDASPAALARRPLGAG
jgi:hypothetical protein